MAAEVTPSTSPPARMRGLLAALRNGVIFLAALAATSAAIGALLPFPNLGNLWRKYKHIEQNGEDYSLIYLGSSRVFHEFIPKQFDADLAQRGFQVKSFNFGQDGMWPPESLYMAREILAMRPPKLKWLLIDLMAIKGELDGNETSRRAVYWHDLRHTLIALRHVVEVNMKGQRTFSEKLSRCVMHLRLFVQQSTSIGRGVEAVEVKLKLRPEKRPGKVGEEGYEAGGFGPLTGSMLAEFNAAVERLKANPEPRFMHPVLRDAFTALIAEARAAGVEPIFVVASSIYGAERFRNWPPERVTVLRFDDPVAFPELYDPAVRYDPHHLDQEGAERFTRRLAEQFVHVLERAR